MTIEQKQFNATDKVLFILLGILCAVSAGAVSYASPYRGAGQGVIYTMSSPHNSAATDGLAQAPVATMGSVSSASTMGATRSANAVQSMATAMNVAHPVKGIYTAATAVSGGVTTYDSGAGHRHKGNVRRLESKDTPPSASDDGYCEHCHYIWDESLNLGKGGWICESCGCELKDGCDCAEESGYCWCPLDFNWGAMVFLMLLAVGYAMWKKNRHTMPDNGRC